MCVLSIKVPIRKKSGNLFNDPRTSKTTGKMDILAERSTISLRIYKQMCLDPLADLVKRSNSILYITGPSSHKLVLSKSNADTATRFMKKFFIVDISGSVIIGLLSCQKLVMIILCEIRQKIKDGRSATDLPAVIWSHLLLLQV